MNKAQWFELLGMPAILWLNLISKILDFPWVYLGGRRIITGSLLKEMERPYHAGDDKF